IKLAYDLLVHRKGKMTTDCLNTVEEYYRAGKTDEFMDPIVCSDDKSAPYPGIQAGDVVLFYNYRTDRPRELTLALTQKNFPDFQMYKLPLYYVTMTNYDKTFKNIHVLFEKEDLKDTIGEVLSTTGKSQVRIAETEKYPHVTFFFSGGREEPFAGERRILIPSPKVATYDLQPKMSAKEITDAIIQDIQENTPDFICLNYANTDMVGHTGVFEAAIKAAQTVDNCVERLVSAALEKDYGILIIADHGNSDFMINPDGTPHTAHTLNPVPCIYIPNDIPHGTQLSNGRLADIAPTLLAMMDMAQPSLMTGHSLITQIQRSVEK
ncbi:MAG TPA: phosphoglycerate mutase (2,3-diphosphoglycerate-independent), partial [Phaeodactylibacter sp.]|nr:phosphoglycerate mutase (2,3-diphosphoglycerate-independent) [Phaeodactylibacter sp.]